MSKEETIQEMKWARGVISMFSTPNLHRHHVKCLLRVMACEGPGLEERYHRSRVRVRGREGMECLEQSVWQNGLGVWMECLLTNGYLTTWPNLRTSSPAESERDQRQSLLSAFDWLKNKSKKKIWPITGMASTKRTHMHAWKVCFPRKPENFDNQCDPHPKLWEAL